MTINPSDLQAVVDRHKAGENLSPQDLQILVTALRSREISIATGERAVAVGGSADGATIVTGNGNFFFDGVNAELILNLRRERSLPDSPRVAPLPRVRLPDNFVPRPDALNAVKAKLLGEDDQTLVVSAIAGLGGIGKSVLATALVLDPEVQARFEEGILWVTLGQNPDLLSLLGDWIRELDKSREAFNANTLEAAAQYLGTLLVERRMLLVVDDVWNAAHVEWFRVGGGGCRILVTTREEIIQEAGIYRLDLMSPQEALALIKGELGNKWTEAMEQPALEFARLLGYLPLALKLMAIQVARGKKWGTLKRAFLQETERFRSLDHPGVPLSEDERRHYSLRACFQISLKWLKSDREECFERFLWLGVLPEDVEIRESMAKTLWNVEDWEAEDTLLELYGRSFLTSGVDTIEGERSYRIHGLMHDLAKSSIDCPPSNESNQLGGLGMSIAAAHQGFLERYRTQAEDRRWDKLPSDGYIHRRLTWHMKEAGWLDEIHALMAMNDDRGNNAWFEACDRIGQPAIFVEDVARAWELAEQMYESERTKSIRLQCRYALITATLNSLVANLPIRMIVEFVKGEFWTVEQAWAYVEKMQSEDKVVNAIDELAPHLIKPLFSSMARKARSFQHEGPRAEVLTRLATIDSTYFDEALEMAQSLQDESARAWFLSRLAAIDRDLFQEALAAARSLQNEFDRAWPLSRLAAIDRNLFQEALAAARSLQNEPKKVKVLKRLARIDGADFSKLLEIVDELRDESSRAMVLNCLAIMDGDYFGKALEMARLLKDKLIRAELLSRLATIDGDLFKEALEATSLIPDESIRAKVLNTLATIEGADFSKLLAAARSIRDESSRAIVLSRLGTIDSTYYAEALEVVNSLQNESSRAKVLSRLATTFDNAYYAEALEAARSLQNESSQAEVLSSLATIYGVDFSELLEAVNSLQNKSSQAEVLSHLATTDDAYFSKALAVACLIRDEPSRAKVLSRLATTNEADFSKLLAAARSIRDESSRAEVLSCLVAPSMDDSSKLLEAARSIRDKSSRARVLISLAAIDNAHCNKAFNAARSIRDEFSRAEALVRLAAIDNVYFNRALEASCSLPNEFGRAEALVRLAAIDNAYFDRALEASRSLRNESRKIIESRKVMLLNSLATIDGVDFSELLEEVLLLRDKSSLRMVFSSLIKHISPNLLFKIWEAMAKIAHKPTRAAALSGCLSGCGPNLPLNRLSCHDWCNHLHLLSHQKRSELMEDIAKLYPAILHLGGATAMRGVVDAMNEVCSQWR